jgi:hypothetical protein
MRKVSAVIAAVALLAALAVFVPATAPPAAAYGGTCSTPCSFAPTIVYNHVPNGTDVNIVYTYPYGGGETRACWVVVQEGQFGAIPYGSVRVVSPDTCGGARSSGHIRMLISGGTPPPPFNNRQSSECNVLSTYNNPQGCNHIASTGAGGGWTMVYGSTGNPVEGYIVYTDVMLCDMRPSGYCQLFEITPF